MELKDIGLILRSTASAWEERMFPEAEAGSFDKGLDDGQRVCAKTLNEILDRCGVPQLEPESDSDE